MNIDALEVIRSLNLIVSILTIYPACSLIATLLSNKEKLTKEHKVVRIGMFMIFGAIVFLITTNIYIFISALLFDVETSRFFLNIRLFVINTFFFFALEVLKKVVEK